MITAPSPMVISAIDMGAEKRCTKIAQLPKTARGPFSILRNSPVNPSVPTILAGDTLFEYQSLTNEWQGRRVLAGKYLAHLTQT